MTVEELVQHIDAWQMERTGGHGIALVKEQRESLGEYLYQTLAPRAACVGRDAVDILISLRRNDSPAWLENMIRELEYHHEDILALIGGTNLASRLAASGATVPFNININAIADEIGAVYQDTYEQDPDTFADCLDGLPGAVRCILRKHFTTPPAETMQAKQLRESFERARETPEYAQELIPLGAKRRG